MTTIEQLGHFVSRDVRGHAVDDRSANISLHIADTVAAWVAGARSPEGQSLLQFLAPVAGGEPALLDSVMLHCALARLSEIDDIHLASATTTGAVIVPAALTIGAAHKAAGAAIAEAILAGYEAMVRLGSCLNGPAILYRGIWPTYFTAPFGVAAVAARLLELDPGQAAHALALALIFNSPGVGHQGGKNMARWLALGHAARHGGTAAFAAQAGFTADIGLLDGDFLRSVYAITPNLKQLTEGLGTRFSLDEVSFKPWCAARQTIAASQGLKEMVSEGLAPDDIAAAVIAVPPPYLRMVNHGVNPGDRSSFLTSAPYQLALGLLDPPAQFSIAPRETAVPEKIRAFMSKVTVLADEKLLEHYPHSWPARLTVETRSGRHEKLVLHVPGDPQRAFDEGAIREKIARVLSPLLGEARAAELAEAALHATGPGSAAGLLRRIDAACR